ncbi:MAG TPA: hypothetical protein VFO07_06490 [Roseiflexaceae bacterium]|nr:hypothetical protein [Roseiflexaceae bacterium]
MLVPTLRPSLEAAPARRALNLALALMLPLALLALALHLPATHNPAPIAAPQVPPLYRSIADLPQPLQFAISRDLGRDDPAYHLTANAARIHAANPAQKFAATVDDEGLHLTAGDQTWALRLAAWGSGDRLGTLPAAQPQRTHDNRLTIDYGAIMAWYVNGPLGLQQGWTIAEPPPGAANGPLTLALDQGGSLSGTVASDQHSLLLRDPAGIVRLRYAGLLAYDADGRELPAWLEADGTRLRISVDATRAAYPLTIDPWVQTAKLTTTDTPDGDLWGLKVAVNGDGSTIVLGAPYQNQHNQHYVTADVERQLGFVAAGSNAQRRDRRLERHADARRQLYVHHPGRRRHGRREPDRHRSDSPGAGDHQ